jgi:hypothetical protein
MASCVPPPKVGVVTARSVALGTIEENQLSFVASEEYVIFTKPGHHETCLFWFHESLTAVIHELAFWDRLGYAQ